MKTGLRYSPFLYCNPCFAAQYVFGFCVYFQRDLARLAAAGSMVQDPEVTHVPLMLRPIDLFPWIVALIFH